MGCDTRCYLHLQFETIIKWAGKIILTDIKSWGEKCDQRTWIVDWNFRGKRRRIYWTCDNWQK